MLFTQVIVSRLGRHVQLVVTLGYVKKRGYNVMYVATTWLQRAERDYNEATACVTFKHVQNLLFQFTLCHYYYYYYYYIPDLYSARFIQNTFTGALHRPPIVAATRAQVHPLPLQIQRDLTRGTD